MFQGGVYKRLGLSFSVLVLCVSSARGQATTSLRGTIWDQSGAVIPDTKVVLRNPSTGVDRATTSGADGSYQFLQVLPGTYQLSVEKSGFRTYLRTDLQLLVNTPATMNVTLEVGAQTQMVAVTAETPLLNTTDASLGVAIGENQVKQLPLEARDVAGLYSMEPGVVYLSNRADHNNPTHLNNDTRSGAVNGARSDQSNITIDGVDANDEMNGYAFTTVLRMNPDALQEFRVSTTNYNADQGRSSGAEVAIVTKGGTNNLHGSLYEYHRNTATSANDYFIKTAQLNSGQKNQAPKLLRNNFGGSIGGPIKKDRAFFFANFEGQRERKEDSVVRIVPSTSLRQGIMRYQDVNGGITTLSPQDITNMDPQHLGPNPVVLNFFQSYPQPNDTSVGDGLNYTGYRFAAPAPNNLYAYTARFDFKLTASGSQNLFWRGNFQNDLVDDVPYLLSQSPLHLDEDYSKGFVVGHTANLRPNLVNNFRYGLTRQSHATLGNSTQPWIIFRLLNESQESRNFTRSRQWTLPVHNFVDDLAWVKGRHAFSFGGNVRFIRNQRLTTTNSFSDGSTNAAWLQTGGIANKAIPLDPAVAGFPAVLPGFNTSYDAPLIALLGAVTEVDATYNYNKQGQIFAQGTPVPRHFGVDEYEFYFQDSFKLKPNFTVTYGLRYELDSPPWETTGLQVSPSVDMGKWFQQRGIDAAKGIPSSQDPLIVFDLAGPANGKRGFYEWAKKNFAPRLAFAYSPRPSSEFFKRIFGEGDKTSIRAGFGLVYDRIGTGLLNTFDQNGAFGLATTLSNPAGIQTLDCAPRLTNVNVIPTKGCSSPGVGGGTIFIPAPKGGFPQTFPTTASTGGFAIQWGLDNSIKTPYSYMIDFSVSRELRGNLSFEAAYVGRLGHRLLAQEDLATPLNFVDRKTGIDYFSAAARLSQLASGGVRTAGVTDSLVGPTAQYWANLFGPPPPGGYPIVGGTTMSAAQAAFDIFSDPVNGFLGNETTSLAGLDEFNSYAETPVTGLNTFFNPQFASLYAWRSVSNSAYHAMQLSLRKRAAHGVQFDLNYTWSKSIDLESDAGRLRPYGGFDGQIVNAWRHKQLRGVSDYDMTHQVNSNWVYELPFGRGKTLGHGAHGVVEALIGGWQLTGIFRWTSGLPFNIDNGFFFPTDWQLEGTASLVGPKPVTHTTKFGNGTVNVFSNPQLALASYRNTLPGASGARNQLRGDGYFGLDTGLGKRWKMPYAEGHSLQFRWEVFNVTNSTRFDVDSNPNLNEIDIGDTFGNLTGLLTSPRVMQFALRYEF
jgi:hypothetical protein